jgi:hypothetical protein
VQDSNLRRHTPTDLQNDGTRALASGDATECTNFSTISPRHRSRSGCWSTPGGFPLEVHCFEGNKAETKTLIPVLTAFQERHGVTDMVVVANAGMLSAGNLNALEDAGFKFVVGSRISKAPYDLAEHFERHGDYFTDRQILESSRVMGTGKHARTRRVVYSYSFKRHKRRRLDAAARLGPL